ncbi:hypothetical protein EI555_006203, partial [Monodon monoceros]
MALASSLAQLQAEASCPICLDYLRDAVTTDWAQLLQCWEGLHDIFPCRVCLQPCPDKGIRRNSQLCLMIDCVRNLPNTEDMKKWQKEKPLCEKHRHVLSLFCEKDLELLCPQCRVFSDHRGHPLAPMEQPAPSPRRRIKAHIEPLTKQLEDAEKALEMQISKSSDLMWEHFLGMEHDLVHVRLLNEEKRVQDKIIEEKNQISNHGPTLQSLLDEITEKCLQPDLDLLTDIERIHSTYENLESPTGFSYDLKEEVFTLPQQYFGLHKMISTFHVDLTFNPETAHHSLIISQDRKMATFRGMEPNCVLNPEAFTSHLEVLSSEGFDAGRHFWQVKEKGLGEWSLGVCKETFPRNAPSSPSPSNGCWRIQLWGTTHGIRNSGYTCWIGVFLDYELG